MYLQPSGKDYTETWNYIMYSFTCTLNLSRLNINFIKGWNFVYQIVPTCVFNTWNSGWNILGTQ